MPVALQSYPNCSLVSNLFVRAIIVFFSLALQFLISFCCFSILSLSSYFIDSIFFIKLYFSTRQPGVVCSCFGGFCFLPLLFCVYGIVSLSLSLYPPHPPSVEQLQGWHAICFHFAQITFEQFCITIQFLYLMKFLLPFFLPSLETVYHPCGQQLRGCLSFSIYFSVAWDWEWEGEELL